MTKGGICTTGLKSSQQEKTKVMTRKGSNSILIQTPNRSSVKCGRVQSQRQSKVNKVHEQSSKVSAMKSSDQGANLVHDLLNDREVDKGKHRERVVRMPLCCVQEELGGSIL